MTEERLVDFQRHEARLLDEAAAELIEETRDRLDALNKSIEAETIMPADASDRLDALERWLAWLDKTAAAETRTVKLCEKVTGAVQREYDYDEDALLVLIGGYVRSRVTVATWNEPRVRITVRLTSYDEEREVAQARLDAVEPLLTRDVGEILTTFDWHGVDDLASLDKMLRFRNVDTSEVLPDVVGWDGPILAVAPPEQTSLTTRYGGRRFSGRSLECDGVDILIPAVARLVVVAPGVTVRGFAGGSLDVIAYQRGITLEDTQASVRAYARTTLGIRCEQRTQDRLSTGWRDDLGAEVHVVARDVRGSLTIHTDTTRVEIADVGGNLRVHNAHGSIDARLTKFDLPTDARWDITTAHGNIEVELPAPRHVGVRLETDWGCLHGEGIDGHMIGDDLPLHIGSGPRSETEDAQIKLSSVSGDVLFRRLPTHDGFESTPEYRLIVEVDELAWTGAADEALALLGQARDVCLGDSHAWFKLGMMLYDGELHEAALEAFDGCATHGGSVWGMVWAGHML